MEEPIEEARQRPLKRKSFEAAKLSLSQIDIEDELEGHSFLKKFRPAGKRAPEYSVEYNCAALRFLMGSIKASKENATVTILFQELQGVESLKVISARTLQRDRYAMGTVNEDHL